MDQLAAAGHGSTSSSCAIIRTHYSTLEGTAIANNSWFDWKNWPDYIAVPDESGFAKFHQTGLINIYAMGHEAANHMKLHDMLGIPYEIWNREKLIHASENDHDHDVDPLQVPLRHVDLALNTGIFSRNRDVIQDSSFSVMG